MPTKNSVKIGEKYGKITVLEYLYSFNYKAYFKCKCDCGRIFVVRGTSLKYGSSTSCGRCKCVYKKQAKISNEFPFKKQLYSVWRDMIRRCEKPRCEAQYKSYKLKGIIVCDDWKNDFATFYEWSMANGYKYEKGKGGRNKWTIDRIDNNKGYSPDNCRWADWKTQAHNKGISPTLVQNVSQ